MDFDTDSHGSVTCHPLVDYDAKSVAGMAIILRLNCARSEAELPPAGRPTLHHQIGLTPAQARLLAEDLAKWAQNLESQSEPPRSN